MRKVSVFAIAMLVAASTFAQTNVTSVNAVGFVKTTVPDGGWTLLALPFEDVDGSGFVTISDVIPNASNGTTAWTYRDGAWLLISQYYAALPGWYPATNEFIRADSLFINAASGGGDIDISINGEVPGAYAPTTTVVVVNGWTLMGYAYPSDIALSDSSLSTSGANGDTIWHWDQGAWSQLAQYYSALPGWVPTNIVLTAGTGYFYSSTGGGFDWTENKPYVWP